MVSIARCYPHVKQRKLHEMKLNENAEENVLQGLAADKSKCYNEEN